VGYFGDHGATKGMADEDDVRQRGPFQLRLDRVDDEGQVLGQRGETEVLSWWRAAGRCGGGRLAMASGVQGQHPSAGKES